MRCGDEGVLHIACRGPSPPLSMTTQLINSPILAHITFINLSTDSDWGATMLSFIHCPDSILKKVAPNSIIFATLGSLTGTQTH